MAITHELPELSEPVDKARAWSATLHSYEHPVLAKSGWQVLNTVLPFFGLWYLMYLSVSWSYWLTLLLSVPTAGLLVRIFVIQHDCGHHSFFKNYLANDILGSLLGILTITPYHFWRRTHARHHVTSGNLNHRGYGDVGMLTVAEYLGRSPFGRLRYRLYRHPLVMFLFGAVYMFMISFRLTSHIPRSWRNARRSVHLTNFGIVAVLVIAYFTIGLKSFFLVHSPVSILAAMTGVWLFYVQHQFEMAYWQPDQSWEFSRSAFEGSSYYRLPRVLQWFTGNIGFHHIHHLDSRIPNYNLEACHAAEPEFERVVTFGVWDSLRCASYKLWDERLQRMVSFADVHR